MKPFEPIELKMVDTNKRFMIQAFERWYGLFLLHS